MSSSTVATATSARTPVKVASREPLLLGGTVVLKVPVNARKGTYLGDGNGAKPLPYLQYSQGVRGGCVNLFVHTDVDVRGRTGIFSVTVLKKVMEDDRQFLYVDLTPLPEGTPVTHRLAISSEAYAGEKEEGWEVFETPAPLRGRIVLAPAKASLVVVPRT